MAVIKYGKALIYKDILVAFLLVELASIPGTSWAWGPQGHRVAGGLTEPLLDPETRAAIHQLLGDERLAGVSTWADRMRSNPSAFWQEQAGPYHYVTVPPGQTYAQANAPQANAPQANAPAKGDAVTALRDFERTLRDPEASRVQKQLALRFSIHIIQDLHQPLHVGRGDDRGGNDFKLRIDGAKTNLHRVWDSGIINHAERSDRTWLEVLTISAGEQDNWRDPNPETWIAESAALRESIYPQSRSIDDAYLQQHLPAASLRLRQAAVRTAAWLQWVLTGEGG